MLLRHSRSQLGKSHGTQQGAPQHKGWQKLPQGGAPFFTLNGEENAYNLLAKAEQQD